MSDTYCMHLYGICVPIVISLLVMNLNGPNPPFIVWATCFLWLSSMLAIAWSLLLFFCIGDILLLTGADLVNAFVLLSGVIMLPTNVNMLCSIANGRKIDYKSTVVCCPLWLSIVWIIVVNSIAAIVCLLKIVSCRELITQHIYQGMKYYRSVPKYKHFLDNLQWSLKCCGLKSYDDWFTRDWYDKIRDYEWDPTSEKKSKMFKKSMEVADSVPLSCCKSGSCISNYLTELGTYSINTSGCAPMLFRIVMVSLGTHLAMFVLIVLIEITILKLIMKEDTTGIKITKRAMDVRHIMTVKDNFEGSSESCQMNPDDTDDEGSARIALLRTNN